MTRAIHVAGAQSGVDNTCGFWHDLPYEDESHDCIVLDTPYMEGLFRRSQKHLAGAGNYAAFRNRYSDGTTTNEGPKYHAAVLDLYFRAGREAARVLGEGEILVVKCQDEVSANIQRLAHTEIIKGFRRVQGCQDMPALVAALRARDARLGLGESSAMVA